MSIHSHPVIFHDLNNVKWLFFIRLTQNAYLNMSFIMRLFFNIGNSSLYFRQLEYSVNYSILK